VRDINGHIIRENNKLPVDKQFFPEQLSLIKIDYLKLIKEIANNREVIRTYFFDGVQESNLSQKESFFNALRQQGVTVITRPVRYKELNCLKCNLFHSIKREDQTLKLFNQGNSGEIITFMQEYQKGIDVALVTELLRMARESVYDTAIVVSGDNDYKNAIDCVKSMGKRVEVASFRRALGSDLKEVADKLIFIDNFLDKIQR
jgi:uncharacterized LabA/DUF88 family protein